MSIGLPPGRGHEHAIIMREGAAPINDILMYSPDLTTHVDHLETVFQLLQQHKLYANRKKCELGVFSD